MKNYYSENLNANKLFAVYQTKIDRVKQYLNAEIEFVRKDLRGEEVLELGAGYGRIVRELASSAKFVTGIDISEDSVRLGQHYLQECRNCKLTMMDANNFTFNFPFGIVLCLQNGLSAFKSNDTKLVKRVISSLKENGRAYFSSYSPKFWQYRLAWFQEQAERGLLGEIDMQQTKDGKIVCKDGFTAITYSTDDLEKLGKASGCKYSIHEVDESSIFLVITK